MALRRSQARLPPLPVWMNSTSCKSSTHSTGRDLGAESVAEGRRTGGWFTPHRQQLSLIPWAQETMTTRGHLGGDVSCLVVLLHDPLHSPKVHLHVVRNLHWSLAFLVLLHNQGADLSADSHDDKRQ